MKKSIKKFEQQVWLLLCMNSNWMIYEDIYLLEDTSIKFNTLSVILLYQIIFGIYSNIYRSTVKTVIIIITTVI